MCCAVKDADLLLFVYRIIAAMILSFVPSHLVNMPLIKIYCTLCDGAKMISIVYIYTFIKMTYDRFTLYCKRQNPTVVLI